MSKFSDLIKSKKFWTLIAALVAAFAAYFSVGCSLQRKVSTHGVHIDTVKTETVIKSKKANVLSSWDIESMRTPAIGVPTKWSMPCFDIVSTSKRMSMCFSSASLSPTLLSCPISSIPSDIMKSPTGLVGSMICSALIPILSSNCEKETCSPVFLASLILSAVPLKSRRGGRKGKPRPKSSIRTIPLGGSHL